MTTSGIEDLGIENFKMKQTWIKEKTEQIVKLYQFDDKNDAFQSLAYSLIFDIGINDIDSEEITDEQQDKQIDIIHIEEYQSQAVIHILQIKNESGFKSTIVTQMKNGLDWVFSVPKDEYEKLDNEQFVSKISEVRDIRLQYGAGRTSVFVYYVTNGNSQDLSQEFIQEKKKLESVYKNIGFKNFEFIEVGAVELFDFLKSSEQAKRVIDGDLPIIYDVNNPSYILYKTGDTKAMICSVKAKELAKLSCSEPKDAIFDLNVRTFFGIEDNYVNSGIFNTCTSKESSPLFWFLNNGITMVCDHFEFSQDPDNPYVSLKNVQIVNGCQTTVTLREAFQQEKLKDDARVLIRIYETTNSSLVNLITLTTNNQNKITNRDLKANDIVQVDIDRIMRDTYDYYYERKSRQYTTLTPEKKMKIVPNDRAGQAFLAIVLKKPAMARGFLGKVFEEYYDDIFKNASV